MKRRIGFGVLTLTLVASACDRPTEPPTLRTPEASQSVGQPQGKIGSGVLAALARGESPRVVVALAATPYRDLGSRRQEVASLQDGVLRGMPDDELHVRRRFRTVPAFSAVARNRGALMRLAADQRVVRIDLDEGGTGSLVNSIPFIRADLRHSAGNRGAGVVVGILDTGIDSDHPDLVGALVGEACFGDNNNSIDDVGFCPGGGDRETGAGSAEDDAGHGTHVSGIVASRGTVSGAGAAPAASLVMIKVLDDCSFSGCFSAFSEIVAALDYIIDNPGLGVQIVTASLSTTNLFTGDCDAANAGAMAGAAAVNTLRTNGVTVFAASGNNSSDTQMGLPACLSNVISVGSVNTSDVIAANSNHTATTDILAPGVSIVSLAIGGGTRTASGTSMASPTAAGCAALLIESGEATTPAAIETRLETSSVQLTRGGVTIPRIDCGPANIPPSLTVNNATVTVNEGSTATNGGTFGDANNDPVTLSASIGTVTPGSGTWSWSLATVDGPSESQTVTITADDGQGGQTSETFQLTVDNVAPIVSAGSDVTINSNDVLNFSGSFSDPGVNDAPWSWSIAWGVGSPTTGSTTSQAAAITASQQYCAPGAYTVTLSVTDKDNGPGSDSRLVTVLALAIAVDIQPTKLPNSINLGRGGLLPVAVLSSATLDATTLDPATIVLGDESGTDTPVGERKNGRYYATFEDVNKDGRLDLVLQFEVPALVANGDLTLASTSLTLRGVLGNGCSHVRGAESVRVVP